jgi:Arc/MetJ-type ribon-helix-helix transcriptional regulator
VRKKNEEVNYMETVQIRLTKNMLEKIDELISHGEYPNRSEAIRDGVRKMLERKTSNETLNISMRDLQKFIKTSSK